jgi:transposase
MPNPYPIALRERAVRAYENGTDTYDEVAAHFSISVATLIRGVQRTRETGAVAPLAKRGGWRSPVDVALLHTLVHERPDRTTDELTRAYTRRVGRAGRVHRSSILRALQRTGYVFKKNGRGPRNKIVRRSRPPAGRSNAGPAR